MIITILKGGLGNQMFQFAFGYRLSRKHDVPLKNFYIDAPFGVIRSYDLSIFGLDRFLLDKSESSSIPYLQAGRYSRLLYRLVKKLKLNQSQLFSDDDAVNYDIEFITTQSVLLDGYWQNENFFSEVINDIRKLYIFPKITDKRNCSILNLIQHSNSCAIHVRKTDYLSGVRTKNTFDVVPIEYYSKSVKRTIDEMTSPLFVVFSDDIEWCKKNMPFLPKESIFVNHNKGVKSYLDMQLMSSCKRIIIANSSFSWWGAWLGKSKEVIAPRKWTNKCDSGMFVPKSWRVIS